MTLRNKTLIIVGCSTLAMVMILWIISRSFWMNSYNRLEEDNVRRNVGRAVGIVDGWLGALDRVNGDWASWDDSYTFIQDHNTRYIESNLVDGTFTELDINFIIFADSRGRITYEKAFDLHKKEKMPLSEGLREYLNKNPDLLHHFELKKAMAGIILLGAGQDPIMISSRPILTSNDQGPIQGALLMGRILNSDKLNELSRLLDLPVQITCLTDSSPDVLQELISAKDEGKRPALVRPNGRNSVMGFTLIQDVQHRPALLLSIAMPRDIYQKGKANLRYYLASLLLLAVAFIGSILYLLQKSIVSRVASLNDWVSRIKDTRSVPPVPHLGGIGELTGLAEAINESYLRLRKAEAISIQSQERYRMLVESSPEVIFTLIDEDGRIGSLNASFERITGWSCDDFIGRPFASLLHPEDLPTANKMIQRAKEGLEINPFEVRVLTRSGEIITGEIIAVPEFRDGKMVSILGFARDISERKKAELAILQSERKLRQLSTLLMNAQENERARISRELHDELGQSLTVLKFKIRTVEQRQAGDPAIQAECIQLRQSIDQIIENVRRLSLDLRPSVLEDLGLWGSLQWLVQNTARHYQIESQVEVEKIYRFFPQESQILIFRIFQEALANIGKHAHAGYVHFSVKSSEGRIHLKIKDDGIGFDQSKIDQFTSDYKGLGIAAMYERARILGGELEIRSEKDKGTEVTLII